MSANTDLVRNMVGVVAAIAVVTTAALALGQRWEPPASPAYEPPVRVAGPPTREEGARVFEAKGCNVCHTVDGSTRVGPSLGPKRWGSAVVLRDGTRVRFDEAYVRESVREPQVKGQAGYPPSMPDYRDVLRDRDIGAITEYLKSL